MRRSGSTFSFNVAREILESRGGCAVAPPRLSLTEALSARRPGIHHLVVKTHSPDSMIDGVLAGKAAKCICTIRKPEDAIASWVDAFGFSLAESIEAYRKWLSWHRRSSGGALNIAYHELERAPWRTVLKIGRYLVDDFTVMESLSIWWRYRKAAVYRRTKAMDRDGEGVTDVGFSYYDSRTFFHRGHVSSLKARVARDVLSVADIEYVRRELRDYLDAEGEYRWAD
jgi:hypothetical protein